MSDRLDVRRGLVTRGWQEFGVLLVKKNGVAVSCNGTDVFVTGPARRGRGRETFSIPYGVPARVIIALAESWAAS